MKKTIITLSILVILLFSGCTSKKASECGEEECVVGSVFHYPADYSPVLGLCSAECSKYDGKLVKNRTIADTNYIQIEECLCSDAVSNYEYMNVTCFVSYSEYNGIVRQAKCSLNGFVNPTPEADSCLDASEVDFDCCLANCSKQE